MKDIAIYGAGGFGREIACLIRMINQSKASPAWKIIGFFDDDEKIWGTSNKYGTVLGGADKLNSWDKPLDIAIAVGSPTAVRAIAEKIHNDNVSFPNVIAPTTIFLDEETIELGMGNLICSNCMISCNVKIGNFNMFNGHIPIGHETEIGNYNVVMPSVNISGGVRIGENNFLGVQSVVLQYMKIGNNVRVGANSVIMRNPKDGFLYIGNPAKKIEI